jgi:hypothetical protein
MEVIEASADIPVPAPAEAWRVIVSGSTVPTEIVPLERDQEQWALTLRRWRDLGATAGLFAGDGSFLISVEAAGGGRLPWALVRCGDDVTRMEYLFRQDPERAGLAALSVDGRVLGGIDAEEHGTWVYAMPFVPIAGTPHPLIAVAEEMKRNGLSAHEAVLRLRERPDASREPGLRIASVINKAYGIITEQVHAICLWWRGEATDEQLAAAFRW